MLQCVAAHWRLSPLGGQPIGGRGQAVAAQRGDVENLGGGASRFTSAATRSTLKLVCGARSIFVITTASALWKMAGYFTTLSSPR